MAMPSRKERIRRVVAGYKASPKRFKGTRVEQRAASESGAAQNKKRSADATNIAERQRQEAVVGIRRGPR